LSGLQTSISLRSVRPKKNDIILKFGHGLAPHDRYSRRSSAARVESLIKVSDCEWDTKTNETALIFRSVLVHGSATKAKKNINLNVLFIS